MFTRINNRSRSWNRRGRLPRTPFAHSIAATGILEPASQNVAVGSALSGVVLEVYVPVERVGARVKAGDPLFHVDDRHLQAQLALAKTRAASARAQLTKLEEMPRPEDVPPSEAKVQAAKANADRTRDEYERTRALWFQARRLGGRSRRQTSAARGSGAAMASSPARACALAGRVPGSRISMSPAPPSCKPRPRWRKSAPRSTARSCGHRSTARCCRSTCASASASVISRSRR